MTPAERYKRAGDLLLEALDLPPDSRLSFLRNACGNDQTLLDETLLLLEAHIKTNDFLARPVMEALQPKGMISRIGKYTVEAELGRGGFGRVYRAFDPDVKRQVAIKVLIAEADPEVLNDLLKRFQTEIGTTGNLRHKNIVTLYECGEESGVPYLVMELLEGKPLDAVIKERLPLSVLDKVRIMNQVAAGLAYAHAQGVIHRDIKPPNIMLLRDGSAKIMDFGIARVTNKSTMLTREGSFIGTWSYMAPELWNSEMADEQTDVFAYGIVYYEILTGRNPFASSDINAIVGRILSVEPEALCRVAPECPEALELLVHRAMGKDREVRYQSFSELLLDSEAVLADLQRERAAAMLVELRPLIDSGELEATEAKLLQVVELDPGNREARQLRNSLRDQIRKGGSGKRVGALIAESEALMQARLLGEAERERLAIEAKRFEEMLLERQRHEEEELANQRRERARQCAVASIPTVEPKKPFPSKLVAGGIAATLALAGGLVLVPRLFRTAPVVRTVALVPFEIRTDPPGASVHVGDRLCVTPNCRLELPVGDYRVEAKLNGYGAAVKSVTVHSPSDPGALQLNLLPVTPDLRPKEGVATGTLIVKAGIANALVFVDKVQRGGTDAAGDFTVHLEAKSHDVGVQKTGYVTPREQRIKIAGASQTVTFGLIQYATLRLHGAPVGAELRVNGAQFKAPGLLVFDMSVPPHDGTLEVTLGIAKRKLAEKFGPGQTLELDWPSIAPPSGPKPPPPGPTTAELEAQAWDRVRNSSNPTDLETFLKDYPSSAHTPDAQSRLDHLNKVNPKDGLTYVWIPPGTFTMGCSSVLNDCHNREKPPHAITISKGFWIGQTEVTQAAYVQVRMSNPSRFKDPSLPVESITWAEARAYCAAAAMRLPTEAEWEYAARDARLSNMDIVAWHGGNSEKKTHEVGRKQSNRNGLYDMLGNVWEWTADWYDENYYASSPVGDPQGASSGAYRAVRGGSWVNPVKEIRTSNRIWIRPDERSASIGVRCVGN